MKLEEKLKELIDELDRIHPEGFFDGKAWAVADDFPHFVNARNGHERWFTKKATAALFVIAEIVYENDSAISRVIELKNFNDLIRRCAADLHAEGILNVSGPGEIAGPRKKLLDYVKESLSQTQMEFTHFFPAWTLGMETERPFALGPVTVMTREQWIDTVEVSRETIDRYLSMPEENAKWKDILKQTLKDSKDDTNIKGLALPIYSAIRDCPSIIKVTVKGYELELSRRVAEIVCKSALDAVSLLFGGKDFFHQQALRDERLQPIESSSMLETDGWLWLPGYSLGPRFHHLDHLRVCDYLADKAAHLNAFGRILSAIVDPASSRHPNLSKRWLTALDWLAEGTRERNDAVALAKIASSLDVLSCGGKFGGILGMLVQLTGISEESIVVKGRSPRTLREVVKDIYDNGRSQILHGTQVDRLKSFEAWRNYAAFLARLALIASAIRLDKFAGPDGDKEFRTMPG